ncbi:39 kDa core protein [Borealpox virus]|nr:39 kDa core protein [Alaskapox virus]
MDVFSKFSRGLVESSTPKSSIYYSEEKDTETKKDEVVEIGLKSQESYYQRQLREQLARDNKIATSMQPIQPIQPTIYITPQPSTPTPAPILLPTSTSTSTSTTTPAPKPRQQIKSSDNSNLLDWLSISDNMQNDNTQSSSLCPVSTPSNPFQDIVSKFNKDQKTTTPSSNQPSQTLPTTTCTQQSDGSISCTTPVVTPPQPPIVATVCTPTPTGGTVCTTAQQNTNPNPCATSQQNLDDMSLRDLMSNVEKDMNKLQAETTELVTNVYDAREYTRRAIDQILQLVKGFERFQK